eukprot:351126-Chlamydomonas_euryale.AAC.11
MEPSQGRPKLLSYRDTTETGIEADVLCAPRRARCRLGRLWRTSWGCPGRWAKCQTGTRAGTRVCVMHGTCHAWAYYAWGVSCHAWGVSCMGHEGKGMSATSKVITMFTHTLSLVLRHGDHNVHTCAVACITPW